MMSQVYDSLWWWVMERYYSMGNSQKPLLCPGQL